MTRYDLTIFDESRLPLLYCFVRCNVQPRRIGALVMVSGTFRIGPKSVLVLRQMGISISCIRNSVRKKLKLKPSRGSG